MLKTIMIIPKFRYLIKLNIYYISYIYYISKLSSVYNINMLYLQETESCVICYIVLLNIYIRFNQIY